MSNALEAQETSAITLPLVRYRQSEPLACFVMSCDGLLIACPTGFSHGVGFQEQDFVVYSPNWATAHRWEITPVRLGTRIRCCIALSYGRTRAVLQQIYPYQRAPISAFSFPHSRIFDTRHAQ